MTLDKELCEIAGKVAGCKAQLEWLSARIVNTTSEPALHELRKEQGRIMGDSLSYRLAFLYKIEEHWPAVLDAIRRSSTTAAIK